MVFFIEKESGMKKQMWVIIYFLVCVATVGAQERTSGDLSASEVVSQTRIALEELTTLEASALADLEAFERSQADLRRAIADVNTPLPNPPLPFVFYLEEAPLETSQFSQGCHHRPEEPDLLSNPMPIERPAFYSVPPKFESK